MQKVRLSEALASFKDVWSPRIVGELNGQMQFRDATGNVRQLEIHEGEFVIVPRGTEHCPCAAEECHVLLFEPAGTLNTGNVKDDHTVEKPNWIVGE